MYRRLAVVVGILLWTAAGVVSGNADRALQSVLTDIENYERQFAGQTTPGKAAARRVLRLLELRRRTLDGLPEKDDPRWQEADRRLEALRARLRAALDPAAGRAPAPQAPAAAVQRTTPQADVPRMISQDRVRLKKLKRDMDATAAELDRGGVQPFHDPAYVARYEQRIGHYERALASYRSFAGDPDVEAARASLETLQGMLRFGKQEAAKAQAGLGDVQARLRRIDTMMQALELPPEPQPPLQPGQLRAWLGSVAEVRKKAREALEELQEIAARAHLPNNPQTVQQGAPYDRNDVRRMQHHLTRLAEQAAEAVRRLDANLNLNLEHAQRTLQTIGAFDPADEGRLTQHFLGAGRAEAYLGRLQEVETLAAEAAEFSRLLGDEEAHRRRAAVAEQARRAQAAYRDKRQAALSRVTLPEPASTDPELLRIARETLARPKYGVGRIERMVIHAPRRSRSMETSEEQYDSIDVSLDGTVTLKGTRTTYRYEWDEFQVATAEREGDKFYIYYNTLKYFTSGGPKTPLERWVLAERFQGSEIPRENIHR